MTSFIAADIRPGLNINCNGYSGTIRTVHTGQLEGMVDVRLARGEVCVPISELLRFQNHTA